MRAAPVILRRYPGLRPFERGQSALFHGRKQDIFRLSNLIMHSRLSVLFSKSGIGKTSLLEAGVAPELEARRFTPIYIRVNNSGASIVEMIAATLSQHPSCTGSDDEHLIPDMPPTLWELLKRLEFDLNGLPAVPVLVLDQFEETFTLGHAQESLHAFLTQLADLANEVMPDAVRDVLRGRMRDLDASAKNWWERQPDVRMVISIRSDFLHALDEISPMIPSILSNRYQLQALDKTQAREAIAVPAALAGGFICPPFSFSPEALAELLDFLSGVEGAGARQGVGEIESFHLQILCRHIEEKIINENRPEGFVVTPEFYESKQGLAREIDQFYERQIESLPEAYARRTGNPSANAAAMKQTARLLIEESLVTPNDRRCSMVDDFLLNTWGVPIELLDAMVETRLLRKENRLGDAYYEISHDTLLPAVIASRNSRRLREENEREKVEYEKRLAEESERTERMERELKALREKRRIARRLTITFLVALLFTLVSFYLFIRNWYYNIRNELAQAESFVYIEQFEAAENAYRDLLNKPYKRIMLSRFPPHKTLKTELDDALRFREAYEGVNRLMNQGDSLYFADDFAKALDCYRQGAAAQTRYQAMNDQIRGSLDGEKRWRVNKKQMEAQLAAFQLRAESAYKTLRTKFDIQQRKYEDFNDARAWNYSERLLASMERLLPAHPDDLRRLQRDLALSDLPDQYVLREKRRIAEMLKK